MTHRLSDRQLDRLLAGLPREPAPRGFSRRVLADVAVSPRRRQGRRWLLPAAVAAAALVAGLWLLPRAVPEAPKVTAGALEREHRLLMEELESLKASLRQDQVAPVLYLGGNESLDLVLDLEPVWRSAGGARPATGGVATRPVVATDRSEGGRR